MTESQIWKYRAEWAKAWKILRAAGRPAKEQEAVRKRWHVLIGATYRRGPNAGEAKSSKVLTNREFDAFLKRCAGTHTPAGFAEQMSLDEQPEIRALTACAPLLDELHMPEEARRAYVAGIYRNTQRTRERAGERVRDLHEMADEELQAVLVALTHTVEHKLGIEHNHPKVGRGPQSREAHRVGHQRAAAGADVAEPGEMFTDEEEVLDRSEPDPAYKPAEGDIF